jgi:hypothetical protein
MWIADLSPYGNEGDLRAIGFLEHGRDYPRGEVSEEFFAKLCELISNAWNPPIATGGDHLCQLCRFTGGGPAQFRGYLVSNTSNCEIFVPGTGIVYVAPISLPHYIDAHEYCPPMPFREAVLSCPPMRSVAYFKALLANGARDLVKDCLS